LAFPLPLNLTFSLREKVRLRGSFAGVAGCRPELDSGSVVETGWVFVLAGLDPARVDWL
jgi:hypothetical protein